MALEIMATQENVDGQEASTRGLHETPSIFSQRLGVALNRALERRLGKAPPPAVASQAAEAICGTKGLAFVRHAVRVQQQLADLHAQLQRDQKQHDHATEAPKVKDSSVPSMGPRKRSVGHDDESSDPPRETKRIRIESKGLPRHMPPPAPENGAKPGPQAPGEPFKLSPKEVPIAPRLRSEAKIAAELRRANPAKTQGTVDSSSSRLPTTPDAAVPPTPSNNTNLDPSRPTGTVEHSPLNDTANDGNREQVTSQAHIQNKLDKAPSLPISTFIPDAQGSPLFTAASPVSVMGFPVYSRQQVPSSATPNAFVANVPGIWAIQVGKPSAGQTDVEFVVDQDTASSVRRWAAQKREFDPDARHVVVHVVALQITAVTAAQQNLSQSPGGITPQAFALALRGIPPRWPDDASLVLQLNSGQPGEQTWLSSDMLGGTPLDISGAVCAGTNTLRITQLRNMGDTVFAMYAAPPTPDILAAALKWEKGRKWTSFLSPRSGRLPV